MDRVPIQKHLTGGVFLFTLASIQALTITAAYCSCTGGSNSLVHPKEPTDEELPDYFSKTTISGVAPSFTSTLCNASTIFGGPQT